MKKILSTSSLKTKNILLLILFVFSACSSKQLVRTPDEIKAAYKTAIVDATVAEPNEISRDLIAVIPLNKNLFWKEDSEKIFLLVVTWTSWDGYDNKVGQKMELARDIWVTVVPELKRFCDRMEFDHISKALRLEQLLGLPPENGKTKFVEFWVEPNDLFRPAPDPEISDHEAELDFPVSERFITIHESHKKWFNDLKNTSYGENGYPWTRLGYTYDWGNPVSEVGLSEFVVRQGAIVGVHSVTPTAEYCKGNE